ncbi:MAG: NAD-binding protein [Halobacteriales archaeon]
MESASRWRRLRRRVTIGLVMVVAVLSVVTGVLRISQSVVVGPFSTVIPAWIEATVGFTGALTGFLMIGSALGLRRGLRVAWYSSFVLLPVTAIQGLLQVSPFSIPLIALSVFALPNLLAHRRAFDRSLDVSTSQAAAVSAIVGALLYGTVGAYALRSEFEGIVTLVDAFYYALVTASTVGYGDAIPLSQVARLFGASVVVVGTASFAIALGSILGPAIEARLQSALGRMTETQLELLEDHVLVLGHGELTDVVIEELTEGEYLIVTPDGEWARRAQERGADVLVADPSDEATLERARISEARAVLVATNNDAEDALSVLTSRQLNPDVRIVAAATNRENVRKLRRAGADTVISPASIVGSLLVESALGEVSDVEALARELTGEDGG